MTTTHTTATAQVNTDSNAKTRLLRTALKVDAVASGITGLGFIALGPMHEDLFGLPTWLTLPTGIFLLAFAAFVWFTGSRPQISQGAVWAIIAMNILWVVDSIAVIVSGWLPLTSLGIGYLALVAAAVALFAELEYMGLKRSRRD